jgi:hypothetical protein
MMCSRSIVKNEPCKEFENDILWWRRSKSRYFSKHRPLLNWHNCWRIIQLAPEIVAFHPSCEGAERASELIQTERDDSLTEAERKELESSLGMQDLRELVKLEAHRQLRQQASSGEDQKILRPQRLRPQVQERAQGRQERHRGERLINGLKPLRRMATCYEKRDAEYCDELIPAFGASQSKGAFMEGRHPASLAFSVGLR